MLHFKHMRVLKRFFYQALAAGCLLVVAGLVFSSKANAATLTVSTGCTLNEAIDSVNDAASATGCTPTGAYGTNDTINIPAGTTVADAFLPVIDKSLTIQGAGQAQAIVDLDEGWGIRNGAVEDFTVSITIKDLSLTNSNSNGGFTLYDLDEVTIENVTVYESGMGAAVLNTRTVTIKNSTFRNNERESSGQMVACGLTVAMAGQEPSDVPTLLIENVVVLDNTCSGTHVNGNSAGLVISVNDYQYPDGEPPDDLVASHSVTLRQTSILNNRSTLNSGLVISSVNGTTSGVDAAVSIDATTIANNTVVAEAEVVVESGENHNPVFAGALVLAKLADQHTFTNTTIANNSVTLLGNDNRNATAGFWGILPFDGANMRITSTTIVGNSLVQPARTQALSAFVVMRVDLDFSEYPTIIVNNITGGSSALNALVVKNTTNGVTANCAPALDISPLISGASEVVDATPTNLGYNMSDDQSCTGYTYVPNLYDTIDHEVADNGGPVPTIRLYDDSPAVNGGGQVQGITTDARGVARTGYYSVGAYQGNLLSANITNAGAGQLAKTGVFVALASPIGLFLIAAVIYSFYDYRRHKQPLLAVDPNANYSYFHHIKVVSVPLVRYRLSVSVDRAVGDKSDQINRYG